MAQVNRRTTESKYISLFADSRPDVDMTFRDVVLSRPTDHYLVGVDNLTLCSSGLSMIEPRAGGNESMLLRIVRKPAPAAAFQVGETLEARMHTDGRPLREGAFDTAVAELYIDSTDVITSVQQLIARLNRLGSRVNQLMNSGAIAEVVDNGELDLIGYTPYDTSVTHLAFSLTADGRLVISGTAAFWTCFLIEIPSVQNQVGFAGDPTPHPYSNETGRRFLTMDPHSGFFNFDTVLVMRAPYSAADLAAAQPPPVLTEAMINPDTGAAYTAQEVQVRVNEIVLAEAFLTEYHRANSYAVTGNATRALVLEAGISGNVQNTYDSGSLQQMAERTNGNHASSALKIHVELGANLFSTLDRRIAIEMGCSLPIKNSPMVDHQKETPDFVLGRWILKPSLTMATQQPPDGTNTEYRQFTTAVSTTVEYQRAQDRIVYHELQAQQKLQVLRVRLFARLRTFNESDGTWSMRVIDLPTVGTDWWHARLHFVSKD